jgi:hypothetical protein
MIAIVLFLHPREVTRGMDALAEHGFDCEIIHDAIDDYGPTVFCTATLVTELDIDEFQHLVESIVAGATSLPGGRARHLATPWHGAAVLQARRTDHNNERPHSRLCWMSPAIYAAVRRSAVLRSTDGTAPRIAATTAQGITDDQTPSPLDKNWGQRHPAQLAQLGALGRSRIFIALVVQVPGERRRHRRSLVPVDQSPSHRFGERDNRNASSTEAVGSPRSERAL